MPVGPYIRACFLLLFVALFCPGYAQVVPASKPIILSPSAQQDVPRVEVERARALRREFVKLYKNGAYEAAARTLHQLHEMTDDYAVLFDLAITYQQLYQWEKCAGYLGRYLEEAPPGPKRDRAFNTKISCELRGKGSQTLIIETEPPGADVYLSNRNTPIQGQTPFRAQRPAGTDRVWLELPGYEPEIKDIEIRRDEPMRLRVILKKRIDLGWLFVDSTVLDAQVYLDGKALQLTPFTDPVSVNAGWHQVKVQREGFEPFTQRIEVEPFLMTRVDVPLARSTQVKTWRSNAGWLSAVVGLLGIAGGATAMYFADQEYNDTPSFDRYVGYQNLGYGLGGGLLGTGVALITWDALRDSILESDRNPDYGQAVETPDPEQGSPRGGRQ